MTRQVTHKPSVRAQIITRRAYNRPIDGEPGRFETWNQTVGRVKEHQRWLWERALNRKLKPKERAELAELESLILNRKCSVAGRTLWLGGTEIVKRREASMFNCAFCKVETVFDVVDCAWLLMQGCGVGYLPVIGSLHGFMQPIPTIEVVRSTRKGKGGKDKNCETFENGVWTIQVGDSAEAWSKAIGKLISNKFPARKLVIDFSQIRPPGTRLKGYGWISSGDENIAKAMSAMADILNRRAGRLLSRMNIHDIMNHSGTILSSRRSAEIALFDYGEPEWEEFSTCKRDYWKDDRTKHRSQSNNSNLFWETPSRDELEQYWNIIQSSGGSDPAFINAAAARRRAPYFSGVNPCAEILLANHSFCNLVEIDLAKFVDDFAGLQRAAHVIARANYRQTLVNLNDGILQRVWHENNENLRLCGVGLTGIARRTDLTDYDFRLIRYAAVMGAYSMADELGQRRPANVTTIKPSGTLSKIFDTTEGVHKPLGRFIFNNVVFSKHDELIPHFRRCGYKVAEHYRDKSSVIVSLPVEWSDVPFDDVGGVPVNVESAVSQLNRYRMLMMNYADHNVSITVSYDPSEVPAIIDWLVANWDYYVGVAFVYRTDPTKTAADLGHAYLPQQVVSEATFRAYADNLRPLDVDALETLAADDDFAEPECINGACPVR